MSDDTLVYNGGSGHELLTQPRSLFQGLPVSLYGQRIWYKLPFEDLKELRILCEGTENFERMCEAAKWTRMIEIYMEKDEDCEGDHGNEEGRNDDQNMERGADQVEQRGRDDNNEDGRDNNTDDGRDQDREDGREVYEMCEEEAQVEEVVAKFFEEEENDDYQRTPTTSDNEGRKIQRCPYDRWVRGSGELKIKQVFESVKEFREAVIEYALKGGWNIRFNRWGAVKSEALCGIEKCSWRVYCSYEDSIAMWMIKTFQENHTCFKDGRCKILSQQVICDMFIHELRNDPLLKPVIMQQRIHDRYDVAPSHNQCRKAKKKALELIEEEFKEQYSRMKDYRDELKARNPHSTVEVRTEINAVGVEVFDSFYMCFSGLRDTWKGHCRPIFGIDGCFLKSNSKGQLLAAVGRDANNQIYPFAWAVVQVENSESWLWFIRHLKNDLGLGNGEGFTVISDRQKGLLFAVNQELPEIEHRMCARHIYGNIRKDHPRKPQLKTKFWRVVDSFNEEDYEINLAQLKKYDSDIYEAFMSRNPRNCSRAFFKTDSCCEDALNNFSESYNNTLEKARAMPLIQSLETMRRQTMMRIAMRRKMTQKHKATHSLKVALVIAEEEKAVKHLRTIASRPGLFEVMDNGQSHKVNMKEKTCRCRKWDLTGIPCRHALRVVFDNPKTYKKEDLVSDWYLTTKWQDQYIDSIGPVNGMKFWRTSGETTLEAPDTEVQKGRKKNPQKRIKGVNESPKKGKKATNHGRDMHCYRCGLADHNAYKCPNSGVPFKPRPPKKSKLADGMEDPRPVGKKGRKPKKKKTVTEVVESQDLAGPSQPTQTSTPEFGEWDRKPQMKHKTGYSEPGRVGSKQFAIT
ncbi:unnamed protein product [Microthlaspi erraticum]|uniref:SWIM-type domain-containing protein n=1 Tax=Microthlaspi erraticum TaxID=1685480 RepID=A0A6D2KZA2_9BRAS|nr:unnamed protein product [Microthlaspi erraticum]